MPDLVFRFADPADGPAILDLLQCARLPTGDLADQTWTHFILAQQDDDLLGVAGLEPTPPFGLVRSLAVRPTARGAGLGAQLIDHIERHARALGIHQLGLITDRAEAYFIARGYFTVPQTAAPSALLDTRQFREVCPTSAAIMLKSVD